MDASASCAQELGIFGAGSSSSVESGPLVKKKTEPALSAATGSALCLQVVGSRTVVEDIGLGPVAPASDIFEQSYSGSASVSFTVPELFRIASPDRVDATIFPLGVMAIGASRSSAIGVWFCTEAAAAGFPSAMLDVAVTRELSARGNDGLAIGRQELGVHGETFRASVRANALDLSSRRVQAERTDNQRPV